MQRIQTIPKIRYKERNRKNKGVTMKIRMVA